jgi:hypothetical protein
MESTRLRAKLRANRGFGGGVLEKCIACRDGLDDPRTWDAAPHDFHGILIIAMCAVLRGFQGSVDMGLFAKSREPFLGGFLKLAHGVPSHDTPELAEGQSPFSHARSERFRAAFQRFMAGFSGQCEGIVAIDGKILRRSFDKASGKSPLHMVSAWGCEQRLTWRRSPRTPNQTKSPPCRSCWKC